jgi:purine-nucleoside phosphorylase
MINLKLKYQELITRLKKEIEPQLDLAIILGSGLGDFVQNLNVLKTISTNSLPGYPSSTIPGHEGNIHLCDFSGKKILLFQGRIHFYEGYSMSECILPAWIAYLLKCKKLLITNAAGGINPLLSPGDLMLVDSYNGFFIAKEVSEIIGIPTVLGNNNLLNFPSVSFNKLLRRAAIEEMISLKEGVYWYTKGPSYETPAEIKLIRKFGGDAVGMSTVPEAFLAGYLGLETSTISCITNYASGISGVKLNHIEVTETANRVKEKFEILVKRIIRSI